MARTKLADAPVSSITQPDLAFSEWPRGSRHPLATLMVHGPRRLARQPTPSGLPTRNERCHVSLVSTRFRADAYRRRADDCERAASRVSDPHVRSVCLDMAIRWRRMAEQQQAIDDVLGDRRREKYKKSEAITK